MLYNLEMIKEAILVSTNIGEEQTNQVIKHLKQQRCDDFDTHVRFLVNDILEDITTLIVRFYLLKEDEEQIKKLKEQYLNTII